MADRKSLDCLKETDGRNRNTVFLLRSQICFPGDTSGKESSCRCWRLLFHPWVKKIRQRRKGQPTPVFLPGESHGQRSLAGYSSWGYKESDRTEAN